MACKRTRKTAHLLKILQASTFVLCTVGFIYGAVESWLKFAGQPLSSTVNEVNFGNELLPSMTVCRLRLDTYKKAFLTNITLEEMKEELGMDFIMASQGFGAVLVHPFIG